MGKRTSTSTIPRRQLGRQLREMRQAAGLSIEQAAQLIGRGATTVQRLEKGEAATIRIDDIENLCRLCDTVDQLDSLKALAEEANSGVQDWWHQYQDGFWHDFGTYLSLESSATKLTLYQPLLIPGIVQIPEYARALYRLADLPDEEIKAGVELRSKRQKIITRSMNPTPAEIVIEESVLRRIVESPQVIARQAKFLADLPANVDIRIVPLGSVFLLWGNVGSFNILDFRNEPSVVYIEHYGTGIFYEQPRLVHRYRRAHDILKHVALSPADSKKLARQIAREHSA